MAKVYFMSLLIIAIGLFALGGAYYQWPWFINNYRARAMKAILGQTGMRIFYGVIGAALLGGGLFMLVVQLSTLAP